MIKMKPIKTKLTLITGLVLLAAFKSTAQIDINFDSVNANSGPVDATAYLASYGITVTGISPTGGGTVYYAGDSGRHCRTRSRDTRHGEDN
jgi:hypothetical protein